MLGSPAHCFTRLKSRCWLDWGLTQSLWGNAPASKLILAVGRMEFLTVVGFSSLYFCLLSLDLLQLLEEVHIASHVIFSVFKPAHWILVILWVFGFVFCQQPQETHVIGLVQLHKVSISVKRFGTSTISAKSLLSRHWISFCLRNLRTLQKRTIWESVLLNFTFLGLPKWNYPIIEELAKSQGLVVVFPRCCDVSRYPMKTEKERIHCALLLMLSN